MTVEVVIAPVDHGEHLLPLLDAVERSRADAFVDAPARARFVTSHALLRRLAAERLGIRPVDVVLRQRCADCGGPHGRPEIDGLRVSLSTSGGLVTVAIGDGAPIGVDLERIDGVRFEGFDDVALTDGERRTLARLGPDRRDERRARWWTRKEALLKAEGVGLGTDPRMVEVLGSDQRLADVPAPDGYVCSVAVATGPVGRISVALTRCWSF